MKIEITPYSFRVDQSADEVFPAINNVLDGGREKSRTTPTNSAPSSPTVTRI